MQRIEKSAGHYGVFFDGGVSEFVDFCRNGETRNSGSQEFINTHSTEPCSSPQWYGLDSSDQANLDYVAQHMTRANGGNVKAVAALSDGLNLPAAQTIKRRTVWDKTGNRVSMPRVYSGDLNKAWRRTMPRPVQAPPIVRIVCHVGAHARVEASDLLWRGAAAIAMTRALIQAGYGVEVIAASEAAGVGSNKERVLIAWSVKQARAPLNINAIASSLCFPAAFRMGVFIARARASKSAVADHSIGKTCDISADMLPAHNGHTMVIGRDVLSEQAAREWLTENSSAAQQTA